MVAHKMHTCLLRHWFSRWRRDPGVDDPRPLHCDLDPLPREMPDDLFVLRRA